MCAQIGVLAEDAWSANELCRFRILDVAAYDVDVPTKAKASEDDDEGQRDTEETRVAKAALGEEGYGESLVCSPFAASS